VRRSRRAAAGSADACAPAASPLAALGRRDIERKIGESFRYRGYIVTGFGGSAAGDAVDLGLTRNGERFLVQFRHWQKRQVGIAVIWELASAIAAQGARGGFAITAGEFTPEARKFAEVCGIALLDGDALAQFTGGECASKVPFVRMKLV
jgi:restriction system protein